MKRLLTRLALATILACGWAGLQAQSRPSPQDFAAAFEGGHYDRFKAMIANTHMGMLDRAGIVTALTPEELVQRLRPCTVSNVFEAGVNHQRLDGVEWICRGQPVAGSPCEAVAYGLDLYPLGDRFRIRVHLTTTYDRLACPNLGPAPPAPRTPTQ